MKNYFRIELYKGANTIAEKAALAAAFINGGAYDLDLENIATLAKAEKENSPWKTTVELIGNNILHIDTKIDGNWKTICCITKIEIWETAKSADDLKGIFEPSGSMAE